MSTSMQPDLTKESTTHPPPAAHSAAAQLAPAAQAAASTEAPVEAPPAAPVPPTTATFSTKAASGVRRSLELVQRHPFRAIALVAAAGALVEVELAVGLALGASAAVFLVSRPGSQTRRMLSGGLSQIVSRMRSAASTPPGSDTGSQSPRE